MSDDDPGMTELRDALRVAVPVEDAERVAMRRERLVQVLEREINEAPHRLRQEQLRSRVTRGLRWGAAAAALLAMLGAGALIADQLSPDRGKRAATTAPATTSSPPSVAVPQSPPAAVTGIFETADSQTRHLQLQGRTQVSLGSATKVEVSRDTLDDQAMHLSAGSVSVSVPPKREGRRVAVTTPHATVLVKGTIFTVEVGRFQTNEVSRTRVAVSRGTVVIVHAGKEEEITRGESWISPLSEGTSAELSPKTKSPTRTAQTPPPSTLAEQNNLLQQALSAEKQGNVVRARQLIDRFLTSYPQSPLRGSARAVKKRLQESSPQ